MDFDVIVIGSGFGGAITGCRLAEGGYRVAILERGQRWNKSNYPRNADDMWLWNEKCPEKEHGGCICALSAHVSGGGSGGRRRLSDLREHLVRSSARDIPKGLAAGDHVPELKPHYDTVAKFMTVQQVPANQWTESHAAYARSCSEGGLRRSVQATGTCGVLRSRFRLTTRPDPFNIVNSKRFTNAQGVEQGTCVHLGNCDIGCDADAKNTLDRNYLPWAEKHGADIRELHLVTTFSPDGRLHGLVQSVG